MNTIPNLGFDLVEPPSGRNKTLIRCHSRSYVWAIVPSNCLAELDKIGFVPSIIRLC